MTYLKAELKELQRSTQGEESEALSETAQTLQANPGMGQ